MKKVRFTESQIIKIIKDYESGIDGINPKSCVFPFFRHKFLIADTRRRINPKSLPFLGARHNAIQTCGGVFYLFLQLQIPSHWRIKTSFKKYFT